LGRNALFCCNRYGWSFDSFILNLVRLNNVVFEQWCRDHAASFDLNAAASLLDILFIRDGYSGSMSLFRQALFRQALFRQKAMTCKP
jgi:hypothetical protein